MHPTRKCWRLLFGSHLCLEQPCQVAEACSDFRVVRAAKFLINSQRVLVQWFCLLEVSLACSRRQRGRVVCVAQSKWDLHTTAKKHIVNHTRTVVERLGHTRVVHVR